jgi:hypothetical protein
VSARKLKGTKIRTPQVRSTKVKKATGKKLIDCKDL